MNLSKNQQNAFWRQVSLAASELGITGSAREDYRHKVLSEVGGVDHLGDLEPGEKFENVMMRLCEDAGDYQEAARWAVGGVNRYRYLIRERVHRIFDLSRKPGEAETRTVGPYVAAILLQGRLVITTLSAQTLGARLDANTAWEEIPEVSLRKVLQIVMVELRRLEARKEVA